MGKHSKTPSPSEVNILLQNVYSNPYYLAGLTAMLEGIQIIDEYEQDRKIPENDRVEIDGYKLKNDFVEPRINKVYERLKREGLIPQEFEPMEECDAPNFKQE